MTKRILAGDLGGSKANLAVFRVADGRLNVEQEARFASADFSAAGELIASFARQLPRPPNLVCLGVAGPLLDDRVRPPNLPWEVSALEIAEAASVEQAFLINDLVATAHGVQSLEVEAFAELQTGASDPNASTAVIAAGTGLGVATLVWDGNRHRALPSEGGHVDFAPTDEEQVELLRYLRGRFGRASVERVLSGPGLRNIYGFLVETGRCPSDPVVSARLKGQDPGAVIGELGVSGADPACRRAVALFCRVHGAVAGDLALALMARGGVYLAGGIAPKLLPVLGSKVFLEAFADKGRLRPVVESIPVRVVLEPRVAVYGAGRFAAEEAGWL